jgi:hypothetical protein
MSNIMTLRLQDPSRQVLGLSAYLSEMPLSKLLNPFISDGISTVLGGLIIHHIDRKLMFRRDTFEAFTEMLLSSGAEPFGRPPAWDVMRERIPRILFDFFELLSELKAVNRFNAALEGVTLEMDASYMDPQYIRSLCHSLGETYMSSGASLDRLDYHKASELFFHQMVLGFYKANAKGTAKALTTQLYAHGDLIDELSRELKDLYSERTKAGVVEAIVVTGGAKRRGRPPKKRMPPPSLPGGVQQSQGKS